MELFRRITECFLLGCYLLAIFLSVKKGLGGPEITEDGVQLGIAIGIMFLVLKLYDK